MNFYKQQQNYKYINLEVYEFTIYSIVSFFLPFLIGHPQWLIGTLVNFFLIRAALHFKFKYLLPLLFLPSLGVLSAGIIFSTNTSFLLYYLPFIWLSNLVFIFSYRRFINNKWFSSVISSVIKFSLLFIVSLAFVFILNFPKVFLINMGVLQLITALLGSFLATTSSKFV
ncbi:MAG: hypothetical protein PHX47_02335 [Candidatus ainarchaeum sp.]|nr:hypothetical protein [Candidatus ainarchaeum sp.]